MAFTLLSLVLLAAGSRASLDWDLETRILDTVQDVADVVSNTSYVLIDAYFGLTLAEAQIRLLLDWVWSQGSETCPIAEYIQLTEEKLTQALKAAESMQDAENPIWTIIRPELWEISGLRRHSPLNPLEQIPPLSPFVEDEDITEFAMQGSPDGDESDRCMTGLIHTCAVSPRCWHAQTMMNPPPRGYPLTHRLLFLLTARQLECDTTPSFANVSVRVKIRDMCERILVDSNVIEALDYPTRLRDLFTEQITLCGMEGFREFTNTDWIEKLLSWKLPHGCFPAFTSRRKRNDFVVNNCSMHFSGLAAAALSVALRNMMEDMQLSNCMKV